MWSQQVPNEFTIPPPFFIFLLQKRRAASVYSFVTIQSSGSGIVKPFVTLISGSGKILRLSSQLVQWVNCKRQMAGNANLGTWQVGTLCFSYFMLFSYIIKFYVVGRFARIISENTRFFGNLKDWYFNVAFQFGLV